MVQKSGVQLISWYFFQLFTRLYTSKRWCRISFINSMYDSQTVSLLAFATYVLPLLLVYLTIVLPFSSVLAVDTSPRNTEKNTAGCGHGKNALWDAKRAWRPTYSLAIRSSNWLGKVWQTTKKGIYIYNIYDRKNADIKNKVSLLRWLACGHELFVSMFCCFLPMLKWKFAVWCCWSKVFPTCFDHLEWQRWNMKATALRRGHHFKMMKREQVITKI